MAIINVANQSELDAAYLSAVEGDEIVLADGGYSGITLNRNFTDFVTIRAANPRMATFTGHLDIQNSSYTRIVDLWFTGPVVADNFLTNHHIDVFGCRFNTLYMAGAGDHSHYNIVGNLIEPPLGRQVPVEILGDSRNVLFEYNIITDINVGDTPAGDPHPDMLHMFANFGTPNSNAPSNVTIRKNFWYDLAATGWRGSQGLSLGDPGLGYLNVVIEENLVAPMNTFLGIGHSGGQTGNAVRNNTVMNGYIQWLSGVSIENNVSQSYSVPAGESTPPSNVVLDMADYPNFVDGSTWEQFVPTPGSAADGKGAAVFLAELQAGTAPWPFGAATPAPTPTLSVVSVSVPMNGVPVINPDNTVTFTPDPGFVGQGSFNYTIRQSDTGLEDSATVTVTVEAAPVQSDPPVANNDTATTQQDTPVTIDVLANDTIG